MAYFGLLITVEGTPLGGVPIQTIIVTKNIWAYVQIGYARARRSLSLTRTRPWGRNKHYEPNTTEILAGLGRGGRSANRRNWHCSSPRSGSSRPPSQTREAGPHKGVVKARVVDAAVDRDVEVPLSTNPNRHGGKGSSRKERQGGTALSGTKQQVLRRKNTVSVFINPFLSRSEGFNRAPDF